MKKGFFDVHVNHGGGVGFSVFITGTVVNNWEKQDIIGIAIDQGKIEPDDDKYVDNVTEITEEEYNKAIK